jgi:hypothetical protein
MCEALDWRLNKIRDVGSRARGPAGIGHPVVIGGIIPSWTGGPTDG